LHHRLRRNQNPRRLKHPTKRAVAPLPRAPAALVVRCLGRVARNVMKVCRLRWE
jgi:hypothetical protein